MHFINEFIQDPSIGFFNVNFEMEFEFSFGDFVLDKAEILPVTIANYNLDQSYGIDIDNEELVIESILFMFADSLSFKADDMFAYVSADDLHIFRALHADSRSYAIIDEQDLYKSNINVCSVSDFQVISLFKRYMGKFMPIVINCVTIDESFNNTGSGVPTGELYTNSMR